MTARRVGCWSAVLIGSLSACSSGGGSSASITTTTISAITTVDASSTMVDVAPTTATTATATSSTAVATAVAPATTIPALATTAVTTIPATTAPATTVPRPAVFDVRGVDVVDMPVLSRSASATTADALIMGGGLDRGGNSVATIVAFHPGNGAVTPLGRLEIAVHDAGAAVLNGHLFVFGGGTSGGEQSIVQGGPLGSDLAVVGKMPSKRSDHVVLSDGQRALIIGGFDGSAPTRDVLSTTDGTTFSVVGRLEIGVRYPSAAVVGTNLYVFGGEYNRIAHDEIQIIDLATGITTLGASLPAARSQGSALVLGTSVYLVGGRIGGDPVRSVLRFDPATGKASEVGELPGPLADGASGVIDGVGFIGGGETPKRVATVLAVSH